MRRSRVNFAAASPFAAFPRFAACPFIFVDRAYSCEHSGDWPVARPVAVAAPSALPVTQIPPTHSLQPCLYPV
eukprot:366191-Chlamydomonas_euryale.AAC.11